jgi:hypothetical protein
VTSWCRPEDIFQGDLQRQGIIGTGAIDIKSVREAVEAQGFAGYSGSRLFPAAGGEGGMMKSCIDEVLQMRIARHRSVVQLRRSEMLC